MCPSARATRASLSGWKHLRKIINVRGFLRNKNEKYSRINGCRARVTVCSVRAEGCSLWGVHHIGYSVCAHIINTCAARWRCESESFSTKWSASRERNKEICSCQGSVSQRLLLEIFWKKSHVWRLSALLSSHFKLRSVESGGEKKRENMGWRILMLGWTQEHKMSGFWWVFFFFFWEEQPDSLEEGGEPKFFFFCSDIKTHHTRCSPLATNLLGVCRRAEGVQGNTSPLSGGFTTFIVKMWIHFSHPETFFPSLLQHQETKPRN